LGGPLSAGQPKATNSLWCLGAGSTPMSASADTGRAAEIGFARNVPEAALSRCSIRVQFASSREG
jgi:hypothetical protein